MLDANESKPTPSTSINVARKILIAFAASALISGLGLALAVYFVPAILPVFIFTTAIKLAAIGNIAITGGALATISGLATAAFVFAFGALISTAVKLATPATKQKRQPMPLPHALYEELPPTVGQRPAWFTAKPTNSDTINMLPADVRERLYGTPNTLFTATKQPKTLYSVLWGNSATADNINDSKSILRRFDTMIVEILADIKAQETLDDITQKYSTRMTNATKNIGTSTPPKDIIGFLFDTLTAYVVKDDQQSSQQPAPNLN